ncbi:aldehyde dehydrogenase family protein [Anaerorhabdus sp.]|uniref:aldehyde dehydrogenase family protein n=1 Tax=Anaerorhabdus sp. TaxID=1872524 RepID=UPI002FC83A8B
MELKDVLIRQKTYFNTNKTKSVAFKKAQLLKLKHMITTHEKEIYDALYQDLNKSEMESYLTELSIVYSELNDAIKNVEKWSKPALKKVPLHLIGSYSYTMKEPYGAALILSPWNYPVQLALAPLVGCLAAGNTAILKCSKSSLATSTLIYNLINTTFSPEIVYCVDPKFDYNELMRYRYDYIFFTGSESVGKTIMKTAAKSLTPVSLELGGKSPTFVTKDADINLAAKRIVWAKLLNAGQTCVAPDYVLVDQEVKEEFIKKVLEQIEKQCPQGIQNPSYPKIINGKHYLRLKTLIDNEPYKTTPTFEDTSLKIGLTLFTNCSFSSEVMKEEIFGPILPILTYKKLQTAINVVKSKPKPLACYVFTRNKLVANHILNDLSFGGGCINDCVMHLANHHLPFGGVGQSGMGHYHGKYSFDTFSHEKAIQNNSFLLDVPMRYARNNERAFKLVKALIK